MKVIGNISSIIFFLLFYIKILDKMFIVLEFNDYCIKMNDKILGEDNKVLKCFFNLDINVYKDGVLDKKIKELFGLVVLMVLCCDDCIWYYLGICFEFGVIKVEVYEVFVIVNLVGGLICIFYICRVVEYWEVLEVE